jgi:catechol 2,3-dioxygenase-like lactoylglutathione lyase family enzyme
MDNFYGRSVFFVKDAARALAFYTESLGFSLDWDSHDGVFQVSLFGFELILNQTGAATEARAGHGRVFIGLNDDEQDAALRRHVEANRIATTAVQWGQPTLVIRDLDDNELYFWGSRHQVMTIAANPGA